MKRYWLILIWGIALGLEAGEFELAIWVNPPNMDLPPFVGHTWLELSDGNGMVVSYENDGGLSLIFF